MATAVLHSFRPAPGFRELIDPVPTSESTGLTRLQSWQAHFYCHWTTRHPDNLTSGNHVSKVRATGEYGQTYVGAKILEIQ